MVLARSVPGVNVGWAPDQCGFAAAEFVAALRDAQWSSMWMLLSRESQAILLGQWAGISRRMLSEVYSIPNYQGGPMFTEFMSHVAANLTIDLGEDNIRTPGAAPARYLSGGRAWTRVSTHLTEPVPFNRPTAIGAIVLPMIFEDGGWKVHLLGFGWPEQPTLVETSETYML